MLFDFQAFLLEMREKAEKKETVEKYEKLFGPIADGITEQIWYKEYISMFTPIAYLVPEEIKDDFDRVLLTQLVAGSFSSDGTFDFPQKKEASENAEEVNNPEEAALETVSQNSALPEFIITVQSGEQQVVKSVSELRGFQILRLYEIYIEEQMNLQVLIAEDENEKEAILSQRESRISRWKLILEQQESIALKKQAEKEKEEKLGNLYDQL